MSEVAERNMVLAGFNNRFESLDDSVSFHTYRRDAYDSLSETGLPHIKNEEYKYTNITKVLEGKFSTLEKGNSAIEPSVLDKMAIDGLDVHKLVFVNGIFSLELSDSEMPAGVNITNVAEAITSNNERFLANFGKASEGNDDAFLKLNTALSEDGAFIEVEKNAIVSKPIALFFINDASKQSLYSTARNLIIAGDNSESTFLQYYMTEGSEHSFTNVVTEVIVGENAHTNLYKLKNNKNSAYHIGTTQVHQSKSSVFSSYTFTLSGAIVRNNLNVASDGEGCETHMFGLYVLDGNTHVDNHTAVDHIKPNSYSNELYKGILDDNAKGVFNGKVFVRQEAQKTNAFQSNKNILLSDTSVVNTKPQLEIWADDVKCSHGCTTGQLDEDALFYLRARGLSKDSARALLLYAFAIEVLENVKIEPLKVYLENIISERLHKDF